MCCRISCAFTEGQYWERKFSDVRFIKQIPFVVVERLLADFINRVLQHEKRFLAVSLFYVSFEDDMLPPALITTVESALAMSSLEERY